LRLEINRDIVNRFQGAADCFFRGPAGQVFAGIIDHDDLALDVRRDDAVFDGAQGNGEAFFVGRDLLFEATPLGHVAHHGDKENLFVDDHLAQ